jgi:hypothetical protein
MIGAPTRQLPGGDLVPFGASSTQWDEIVPVFEGVTAPQTDRISRPGRPAVLAARAA